MALRLVYIATFTNTNMPTPGPGPQARCGKDDGMVHISKLENRRVEKVEDVLNLGDMTWVKFMGFDEKGRANFSRRDALKEMAANK